MRFRTVWANRRALRIRRAFDRLYQADPQRAIEYANAGFDEASRKEGDRPALLGQS